MNTWDKCKNCGGERGLHHYATMQCPVGGREAPGLQKQEWMTLTFEAETQDAAAELTAQAAEIKRLRGLLEMYLRYNDDYGLSGTDMRRMLDNIWIPRVRAELERTTK